jgi:hypothetical protein
MRQDQTNYRQQSRPAWAGDVKTRDTVLAGGSRIEFSAFAPAPVALTVSGAVAAGDEEITFDAALTVDLVAGDRILDGTAGEIIVVRDTVRKGATTVTVFPVASGIADAATLTYIPTRSNRIQSGTLLGRTYAERDAAMGFGPADAADDEVYLLLYDLHDIYMGDGEVELYRHGSLVYENVEPISGLSAALLAKVRAAYETAVKDEF